MRSVGSSGVYYYCYYNYENQEKTFIKSSMFGRVEKG